MSVTVQKWESAQAAPQLGTVRRLLEAEGMRTSWYSEVPGAVFSEHQHAFREARWVLSGHLRVEAGGQVYVLGPGDRIDLPPLTPHRAEVVGLAPVIFVTGTPPEAFPRATPT